MTGKNVRNNHLQEALLLLAAVIWGSGFIMTKLALDAGMSAAQLMAFRFTGAAIIFTILYARHLRGLTRSDWLIGGGTGVLLFLGFMTQTMGLVYTTPSRNAFLTATYVVMVPFISAFLLRRSPERRVFAGAAICFSGVAILTISTRDILSVHLIGDLLTLACAVFYAAHLIALEAAVRKVRIPQLIFLQMFTTALCSILVLPFDHASYAQIDWSAALPPVVFLILFSSCLAYFLQTRGQRHVPSARAAILLSTEALFGSILSVIFGLDPFSPRLLIGGLVIFSSILLVEWPEKRAD